MNQYFESLAVEPEAIVRRNRRTVREHFNRDLFRAPDCQLVPTRTGIAFAGQDVGLSDAETDDRNFTGGRNGLGTGLRACKREQQGDRDRPQRVTIVFLSCFSRCRVLKATNSLDSRRDPLPESRWPLPARPNRVLGPKR